MQAQHDFDEDGKQFNMDITIRCFLMFLVDQVRRDVTRSKTFCIFYYSQYLK